MSDQSESAEAFADAWEKLARLRRFDGPANLFWQNYLAALTALAEGRFGLIVRRRNAAGEDPGWRRVAACPAGPNVPPEVRPFLPRVEPLARAAAESGIAMATEGDGGDGGLAEHGLAVRIDIDRADESWVAVISLALTSRARAEEALRRLRVAACLPAYYQDARAARPSGSGEGPASVLDLMVQLDTHQRFMAVAMTLCNELAARHQAERVTLGWESRGLVRAVAMSHTEKFVRKMEAVQSLEAAMEEAFDQDEEICWPPLDGETAITRDHGKFAAAQGAKHLCSIPLRLRGEGVGVITLERQAAPFDEDEVRLLRIIADLAAPRLAELRRRDRWFGARWAASFLESASRWLGPQHTWSKVGAIAGAIALGVLFLGGATYRVEAPFFLRTEDISFIAAPFDGFIARVDARIGATVRPGERVLALDTRDLLLEQAAALADRDRYAREEEKARAERSLAEMRIAEAQLEQARVRLDLVRHRLSLAEIRAPFDGVVVEGDLQKRIGAPVRQGDLLFKVARLDRIYVEARVSERDIHEIKVGAPGEIAFTSRPKEKFPFRVTVIEPVAQTVEKGNIFIVRGELAGEVQDWWRPGMSGVSKTESGWRTFAWMIFHRTIDFLRLFFWW